MKIGISKKVILLFMLLVIILGVALGFYSFKYQKETIFLEFDERVKVLLGALAISSEYPVLVGNEKALDKIGNGILEQRDVVLCEIRNREGEILYKGGLKEEKYCREYTFPILTEVDTGSTGEELILGFKGKETREIGKIYLVLSISNLIKKLNEMKKAMGVLVIFGIFFASVFITILVRFILSKPVNDLIRGIERISGGDLKYKVPLKSSDEIGELAFSFNKMAEDLSRTLVSRDYVDNIISSMVFSLIVTDAEGRIETVNPATLDLLGYREEEIIGQPVDVVIEEEKKDEPSEEEIPRLEGKTFRNLVKNGVTSTIETKYFTEKRQEIPVVLSCSVIKDRKGKIVNVVFVAKDIIKRKQAEEIIKSSLREKEILLQEVHHRVKNNMQIISSLLSLQSGQTKDKKTLEMFQSSQNRVRSMALIHEKLYRSKDFVRIDFTEYVQTLTDHLFGSYGITSEAIKLSIDIKDVFLDINTAIPCGLVINELVSNSLKYAFPDGKKGEVKINMHSQNGDEINLVVRDNGVGIPEEVDFGNTGSLGLRLVNILAESQLHGEISIDRTNGTSFHIRFKQNNREKEHMEIEAGRAV